MCQLIQQELSSFSDIFNFILACPDLSWYYRPFWVILVTRSRTRFIRVKLWSRVIRYTMNLLVYVFICVSSFLFFLLLFFFVYLSFFLSFFPFILSFCLCLLVCLYFSWHVTFQCSFIRVGEQGEKIKEEKVEN